MVLRLTISALLLLIVSCSTKPNFSELYNEDQWPAASKMQDYVHPPIVIIPGIVSSTLVDEKGKEVWFGPWRKTLFSSYKNLGLEIDENTLTPKPSKIVAGEMPEKILAFDFFGSLFKTLETYGNYNKSKLGVPYIIKHRRYYTFPYDWRYGAVDTVRKLDEFIENIRKDYNNPNLKVDLIAHSKGGLIARYYMRYGTADVLEGRDFPVTQAGAKKVRRLIQLGTPNLGTISTVHQLMNGYKIVFGTFPVERLITMPSIYQLLPHPIHNWLITTEGKPLKRDLFDSDIWRRFEWGIYNPAVIKRIMKNADGEEEGRAQVDLLQRYFHKHLERARKFVWSLSIPVDDVEYSVISFGGNCEPTPARMLVEEVDDESVIRLWPKDIKNPIKGINYKALMLEPGDGRVTKPSMLARDFLDPRIARHPYSFFPLNYAFFLCHNHGQLSGNTNFQDNLLNILLDPTREETQRMRDARLQEGDS